MKEILVKDLRVGDIFIDGDRYVVVPASEKLFSYGGTYLRVKCIVCPTKSTFVKPGKVYYIPLDRVVLLCEA